MAKRGTLNFLGDELYPKTVANLVIYSDTTLADVLGGLSGGTIPHSDSVTFALTAQNDFNNKNIAENYLTLYNANMSDTATVPTYTGTDTNVVISAEYMQERIREICGDVESGMTLAKLIESINRNPNFAADVSSALSQKLDKNSMCESLAGLSLAENNLILTDTSDVTLIPVTTLGQNILACSSVDDLRKKIQAGTSESFVFDDAENIHWVASGSPSIYDNCLHVDANNKLVSKEYLTFGGTPFTIDFWVYGASAVGTFSIFSAGELAVKFYRYSNGSGGFQITINSDYRNFTTNYNVNNWCHFEIAYNGAGNLRFFWAGVLQGGAAINWTIARGGRIITLGGLACAFRNFRVIDGVCLHTANFTPPSWSSDYELTNETISLLNF